MTEKNIFVYISFLSLNISDFSLFFCKTATTLKNLTPSFQATPLLKLRSYQAPPFWKFGRRLNLCPQQKGGGAHYDTCMVCGMPKTLFGMFNHLLIIQLFSTFLITHLSIALNICSLCLYLDFEFSFLFYIITFSFSYVCYLFYLNSQNNILFYSSYDPAKHYGSPQTITAFSRANTEIV